MFPSRSAASALALASLLLAIPRVSAQFADAVVDYSPGSGVPAGYTNTAAALGRPSQVIPGPWGGPVDPFNPPWQDSQVVSIGAGGSITLRLDTPVRHDRTHPFGLDFLLFANAGFIITNGNYSGGGITDGSLFGANTGGTRVSVSADGAQFFVLDPALAPTAGGFFPTDGAGSPFVPVRPTLGAADFGGLGLAGIRALYAGAAGGTGYDLTWARETNGLPVTVEARFVRIEVLTGKVDLDAITAVAPAGGGEVWWENFASDPAASGWGVFGDTNLFRWNAASQHLDVTWDSSRPNSYFQLPLGTMLTRRDDFGVALDLTLTDIAAGVRPGMPGAFQISFGFLNAADAHRTNFLRGTGSDSPNLVEFDFFPDTGFGPTVWPVVTATNAVMNYNGSSDFGLYELPVGIPLRFVLSYAATNETLSVSITTNGVPVGPVVSARLMTNFTQFLADTFAITSYSDAGQGPFMPGSILAHGAVDNVVVTAPPPPVRDFRGAPAGATWAGTFLSRTGWGYVLEATGDLAAWSPASPRVPGTGSDLTLTDTNAPSGSARFYRIHATPEW